MFRDDYLHLCQYVVAYLESPSEVRNFTIHAPGACHEVKKYCIEFKL